ncbi:unnamed protein product [Musa banksii]
MEVLHIQTNGVCAIQWSREGSHLAIGAALGDVWYADASVYFLNTKISHLRSSKSIIMPVNRFV